MMELIGAVATLARDFVILIKDVAILIYKSYTERY